MFSIGQILTITIFYALWTFISQSMQFFVYGAPIFLGWITGLIVGDPTMGLLVGGTLQLMGLGVGGYGGSSVPDYQLGTVVGTAFAVTTGGGIETALAIGIPTAALGVQLDVFSKTSGSFFLHKAIDANDRKDFKTMKIWLWLGALPKVLLSILPVLIALLAGAPAVEWVLGIMPEWLMSGLTIAGGLLPALGFAILLKYLPVKKYFGFLILGFALTAYLELPMLGVALFGFAAAYIIYTNLNENENLLNSIGGNYDE